VAVKTVHMTAVQINNQIRHSLTALIMIGQYTTKSPHATALPTLQSPYNMQLLKRQV